MKVVLAAYGTRGNTEPFAAVGRELLRRGHDVCMTVAPEMVGFVELAGLAAVPFGPESLASGRKLSPQDPVSAVVEEKEYLSRAMEEWAPTLTALGNGADLLLTGRVEQQLAANVAEYYGIPQATLHFYPQAHLRLSGWVGDAMEEAEDAHRRALGLADATGPSPRSLEIQAYDALYFPEVAAEWADGDGLSALRRSADPGVTDQSRRRGLVVDCRGNGADLLRLWQQRAAPIRRSIFGDDRRRLRAVRRAALICSGSSDFTNAPHF